MAKQKNKFVVRKKIWLENSNGKVAFGLGRFRILAAIERFGSMNSAATELSMSYRSVWCRIHESEERIGRKPVIRKGKGLDLNYLCQGFSEAVHRSEQLASGRRQYNILDLTLITKKGPKPVSYAMTANGLGP